MNDWLGWLGGVIDGEGSVFISRSTRPSGYRYGLHHRCCVQIANTDTRLIEKARDVIEGVTDQRPRVTTVKRVKDTQKLGMCVQLTTSWEIGLLLPAVMPYLTTKAEQARIVLSFSKRHLKPGTRRSQETFDLDELDYARCRILNRRGNHGGPDINEMERMVANADAAAPKED